MEEIMEDKSCVHTKLYFASGDYYIYCAVCNARWVMTDPQGADAADPKSRLENSNKGSASLLSDGERTTHEDK